jgi:hypothetical protein
MVRCLAAWRHGVRTLLVLALPLAAASLAVPALKASAATTAVSTVYKTGTDAATGSTTAASADAPGGAVTGTAHPGDVISWVVSDQNNTGHSAAVNIKDPLGSAGDYVPGSLVLPPNPDEAQPFTPQYSTDNGATWQPGAPPAGASGVGLTGTFPTGTRRVSVNFPTPTSITLATPSGDGYSLAERRLRRR